ncbi:capsule assembly Wzi family protein [Sediminibacterium sp.]|uniref:capsule assembly Wzi family protein n=1 Tax=Sediminibacterium sp. TaxID=1917865 RepID=UPI003F6EF220
MRIESLFFFLLCSFSTDAQSVPLDQAQWLRIQQLKGKSNPSISYSVRSLNQSDSSKIFKVTVLPVNVTGKFNSHSPYGWNDAGMIMAKGLQTMVSAGVYAKWGPLSIQLQPEFYYAANSPYPTTVGYGYNTGKSFQKTYLGQSAIKLNLGPIAVGVSSQNNWWGPGQFSSIMMSNNAPGFNHITINSNKPIKTPIGHIEFQLVMGRLSEDTSNAFENNFMRQAAAKNEQRYFNGIMASYQPKWIPGFFLGVTRTEQIYFSNQALKSGFASKYLPVFLASSPVDNFNTSSIPSDGAFSFFTRWLLPKHQVEFYAEFAYNDFKKNLRDLSVNTSHASAYILGFNKIISNEVNDIDWLVTGEFTQMAQTSSYVLRDAGNFYDHYFITQGYTHQNQIMGAGSGMGNNVQTIQLKRISGKNFIGIKLQNIKQNPSADSVIRPLSAVNTIGTRSIKWSDISIGFLGSKQFNQWRINAEIQLVNRKNYGWEKGNAFNVFTQINGQYFFKRK